jgi:hypothetical protein
MYFSFTLEGRTSVSSNQLAELFKLTNDDLKLEAKNYDGVSKLLFSTVSKMVENPDCILDVMTDLNPLLFSTDHDWQKIIVALSECDDMYNPVRPIALTKYMQYLSSIDDVIGQIRRDKKASIGTNSDSRVNDQTEMGRTWGPGELPRQYQNSPGLLNDFKKLPKDKTIEITLSPGKRMDILLASYMCQLVSKDNRIQFIDKNRVVTLNKGRNIIGRSNTSTIQITSSRKDVSRSHLVVQVCDANVLQLTDLSTSGSFIPSTIPLS